MTAPSPPVTDAGKAGIRQVLRLLENNDRKSVRALIAALLGSDGLPEAHRKLLQAMDAYAGQDHREAAQLLVETFRIDPGCTWAHYWLAEIHLKEGRLPDAIGSVERALEKDPGLAEGWFLYGALANRANDFNLAMHCLMEAVRLDVDNAKYWHQLNRWLPRARISGPMPVARALLLEAFRRQRIEYEAIEEVIYPVLGDATGLQQILAMAQDGTLHARVQSGEAVHLLGDELVLILLRRTTLRHAGYESALTQLRGALVDAVVHGRIAAGQQETVIRFMSALACYALAVEFVFYVTDAESRTLVAARRQLAETPAAHADLPLLAAAVACYQLLAHEPPVVVARVLGCKANCLAEFADMVQVHVREPEKVRQYEVAVATFGSITNAVSLAVQRQYEEHPYPRWRFLGETHAVTFDNRIERALPQLRDDQQPRVQALPSDPLRILIAGCGTGRHALWCAREYPGATIMAVDLSRASLAYACMKADELGIGSVEFLQGDILELPALGRTFDVIESVGVLHHMQDPASGLAALSHCLRAGGWMKVALYSHLAREPIRVARQRIAENGYTATAEGVRTFRRDILADEASPLREQCTRWRDFFSLSECRDLLFHVQEHQFTTAGLAQLIEGAGLEFMGFETSIGESSDGRVAVDDWQSLEQWGAYEAANPGQFGSMYIMWLRKPG